MAINIEVKYRFKELEEKMSTLERRLDELSLSQAAPRLSAITKELEAQQPKVKLCPHCGEKPAYFFHTRSCLKKNKNNADRNRDPSDA